MNSVLPFSDIHTHRRDASVDSVICLDPTDPAPLELLPGRHYSVGIHPWHTATNEQWHILERMARNSQVVAIGEAGLDALRGPAPDVQEQSFVRQAQLAEDVGKPLIIHAVRTFPQLIALKRRLHPTQPWIIHGFRGKPQLARELMNHGFHLSLGPHHNPDTAAIIPPDRLHRETDAGIGNS